MGDIYILMLVALTVLAIIDLVVGVSNDAVNFLNSAIGSKAIPIKSILIIASVGVALGAITSSGMMEVARKGIFNPGEFYFNEIMFIFMAVTRFCIPCWSIFALIAAALACVAMGADVTPATVLSWVISFRFITACLALVSGTFLTRLAFVQTCVIALKNMFDAVLSLLLS